MASDEQTYPLRSSAYQERQEKETRAGYLRNACRIAGENVPPDLTGEDLLLAFSEADLPSLEYATEGELSDEQIRALKSSASDLHDALWSYSDHTNGKGGLIDSATWGTVVGLYESASRSNDKKKKARMNAALALRDEVHVATHKQSHQIYTWDPDEEIYDPHGEETLRELLAKNLEHHWTKKESSEIITRVSDLTYTDKTDFNSDPYVPVQGADLSVGEEEVQDVDPTPARVVTSRSDASWAPSAKAPRFRQYLNRSVKSDAHRRTLQEYTGYAMMHWDLPFHKALFLVGPTESGKSTFLNVVADLVGSTCHLSPHSLVEERFEKINLDGSWANIRADISSQLIKNIGLWKEIVAGDPIFVEDKNKPGYMHSPTTKHFYSANRLPSAGIDDDAFFRRVLIVPFPETIPEEDKDPQLGEKLDRELDGILRWAIEGLQRLLSQDGFTHDLPPGQTRAMWQRHSSSIGRFKALSIKITGDSDDIVSKEETYAHYTSFCKEKGLSQEPKQGLTKGLTSDPRISDGHRTLPGDSSQSRCYEGIVLKTDDDDQSEKDTPMIGGEGKASSDSTFDAGDGVDF